MKFITKIFNIWKYVIFKPKEFFGVMPEGRWYQTPLVFGVIMMWLGVIRGGALGSHLD